jgi:hypothetical protein
MLAPTDAAAVVLTLSVTLAVLFLVMVVRRQRPWKRRLHEVQGMDRTGAHRSLAVYAVGRADAIRTVRRIVPDFDISAVFR